MLRHAPWARRVCGVGVGLPPSAGGWEHRGAHRPIALDALPRARTHPRPACPFTSTTHAAAAAAVAPTESHPFKRSLSGASPSRARASGLARPRRAPGPKLALAGEPAGAAEEGAEAALAAEAPALAAAPAAASGCRRPGLQHGIRGAMTGPL